MIFYPTYRSLFLLILPQLALTAPGRTTTVDPLVLTPIVEDDTNWRRGNQRREPSAAGSAVLTPMSDESSIWGRGEYGMDKRGNGVPDLSRLDLRKQEHFVYGSNGDDQSLIFANMTMYAADGELIISMERFAGMLENVVCGDNMVLDFKTNESFQYALQAWNWTNEDTKNNFIMVANYDGCGPDQQRWPYYVTGVHYDKTKFIAYLDAKEMTWEDAAQTFDLDFGTIFKGNIQNNPGNTSTTTASQLQASGAPYVNRRLFGWDPSLSWDPSVTLDLASDFSQSLISTEVDGVELSVTCTTCGTKGKLVVGGHVSVSFGGLSALSLSAKPQDFAATLELAISAEGTLGSPYNWQQTLGSIPIAGFEVPEIGLGLGATLDWNVGYYAGNWTGTASVSYGVTASLSNSANLNIDIVNPDKSSFSGWAPTFAQKPLSVSAKIETTSQVYSEPELALGFQVLGKGYEIALDLKLPEIDAHVAALLDTAGVCGTKKTLGVDIGSSIGVNLFARAGPTDDQSKFLFKETIFVESTHANAEPSKPPKSTTSEEPKVTHSSSNSVPKPSSYISKTTRSTTTSKPPPSPTRNSTSPTVHITPSAKPTGAPKNTTSSAACAATATGDLVEYLSLESEGGTLEKRSDRGYKLSCDNTRIVKLAGYPPPGSGRTITDWMQPAAPSICTNWDMVPTPAPSLPLADGHKWATEHIYEGFFIKNFLDDLVSRLSCATVTKLFWEISATTSTTYWIDEVMNSLGSSVNEKFLVYLDSDTNRMKYFADLDGRITFLAKLGRVMNYMSHPSVKPKFGATADSVEATLGRMDKAIRSNPTYAPLLSALGSQTLVQAHAAWMANLVQSANDKAHSSLVNWVSTIKSAMPTADARYPWLEKVSKNVDSAAPPITRV
ncbi:hypothetical protein GP486_004118 [Trichoglossum hirsutum]|uniref:Uncharacterized protein n=1 Tax=Trichoglossum hirsutum TaxID=265104 RepID=A0A9P8LBZ7_9PEZI|nr:hypothetical protein GP486_004118 [Trichoglossum hirsutum]